MEEASGLAPNVEEVRPCCLEAEVPSIVEIYLEHYGGHTVVAHLVLVYRDEVLKLVKLHGEESVKIPLGGLSAGIVTVVIIAGGGNETPEPAGQISSISSVVSVPVLPPIAARELNKVFENSVQAAKEICMPTADPSAAGYNQYLLVEGHVLSDHQEQAIRHMLWKDRFRSFAADLDFLLNNPLNEAPASPICSQASTEDSEFSVASNEYPADYSFMDENMDTDDESKTPVSPKRSFGDEASKEDMTGRKSSASEEYGQVLKSMLKFLSECEAWSCFFHVVKECSEHGIVFDGISEVGLQGLYGLTPSAIGTQNFDDLDDITMTADIQEILSGPSPTMPVRMSPDMSMESTSDADTDVKGEVFTGFPSSGKSNDSELESEPDKFFLKNAQGVAEDDSSPKRRAAGVPLQPNRPRFQRIASSEKKPVAGQHTNYPLASPAGSSIEHSWRPSANKRLTKSRSMPAYSATEVAKKPSQTACFTFADLVKPGSSDKTTHTPENWTWLGVVSRWLSGEPLGLPFLYGDAVSLSARCAMLLVCSWLCLIGGWGVTDLNGGALCLGLSGVLVVVPLFSRFFTMYREIFALATRFAVLMLLILHGLGKIECPCIPSWSRKGYCLGGILQSVLWLSFLSLGSKVKLWSRTAFLALEIGVFIYALSGNSGECKTSHFVVIGPVIVGEMLSLAPMIVVELASLASSTWLQKKLGWSHRGKIASKND